MLSSTKCYLSISRKHSVLFPSFPSWLFPLSSECLLCFLFLQFVYFPASCADFSFSFCCLEVLSSLKHLHLEHLLHVLLVSLVFSFCVEGLLPQRLARVCTARLFVGFSQEVVPSVSWTAAPGDSVSLPQGIVSSDAAWESEAVVWNIQRRKKKCELDIEAYVCYLSSLGEESHVWWPPGQCSNVAKNSL